MNKDKFIDYLTFPDKLDQGCMDDLKGILDEYPYFQTAHLMLLCTLMNIDDHKFSGQLKLSSAYIGNRHVLYNLVNGNSLFDSHESSEKDELILIDENPIVSKEEIPESVKPSVDENKIVDSKADLLEVDFIKSDSALLEIPAELLPGNENQEKSFYDWLEQYDIKGDRLRSSAEKGNIVRKAGDELIDRFLRDQPRIDARQIHHVPEAVVDMVQKSSTENEEFFTETLAKIYVQQKHYKKAIFTYEKLCLKYPEKYSYFAARIDDIKRFTEPEF